MWDNFLGAQTSGGGGYVAAYVPPDWDGALKKQQLTRRGGRQRGGGARGKDGGVGGRREHLWGYDSLEGKCCLPTCLQGCQLYNTHTHTNVHVGGAAHTRMSTHKHADESARRQIYEMKQRCDWSCFGMFGGFQIFWKILTLTTLVWTGSSLSFCSYKQHQCAFLRKRIRDTWRILTFVSDFRSTHWSRHSVSYRVPVFP